MGGEPDGRLGAGGKIDPVIGRDEEIRRVMQVLTRAHKEPNPVLIGEPGAWARRRLPRGLARAGLSAVTVPESLKNQENSWRWTWGQ